MTAIAAIFYLRLLRLLRVSKFVSGPQRASALPVNSATNLIKLGRRQQNFIKVGPLWFWRERQVQAHEYRNISSHSLDLPFGHHRLLFRSAGRCTATGTN